MESTESNTPLGVEKKEEIESPTHPPPKKIKNRYGFDLK